MAWVQFISLQLFTNFYDVIVVGGGPAGTVVAMQLARAGLSILIVDRNALRPPERTFETLSIGRGQAVRDLGIEDRLRTVEAVTVAEFFSYWGSNHQARRGNMLRPDGTMLLINRNSLDKAFREAAIDAGCKIQYTTIFGARWNADCWHVDGRGVEAKARVIVDASGRASRFARTAGAKLLVVDKLVAHSAVLYGGRSEKREAVVEVDATANGWLFACDNINQDRILSYFQDGDDCTASPSDMLMQAVAESPSFQRCRESLNGVPVLTQSAVTQTLETAVLDGLIAVGDAAQTCDPLSSQGISTAIDDAMSAAMALISAFEGRLEALAAHEVSRRSRVLRYLMRRRQYYMLEQRWRSNDFWSRRHSRAVAESIRVNWLT